MEVLQIEKLQVIDEKFVINDGEIVVTIQDDGDGAVLNIDYNENQYTDSQIKQLGSDFIQYLEEVMDGLKGQE